jgi:FG-GAP-like repeat
MMRRSAFLGIAVGALWCALSLSAQAQLINELDINPGGTDNPCEYIELKGTPGSIIQNVHFVAFEGDAAPSGTADFVATFLAPGVAFGSNGLIVITGTAACGSRTYPPETLRLQTSVLDGGTSGLENGTISFLLISSATAITQGTDYDTDNNGSLEGLPAGATILDAVAWTDGDAGDLNYGGVILTASTVLGASTRFPNNTTANSAGAWYGGAMTGTNDATTYNATIRTTNFPANGALTPGAPNVGVAPPDAAVDISGDGKTDYVVVRAAGGVGSQLTWFSMINGGQPTTSYNWGISGDLLVPADYDGDGRDDVAIFRASEGTFYIIESNTLTIRIDQFGQAGDNPRVVGDYNGDGRDDLAVYRSGTQSTWFYKTARNTLFAAVEWGQTGDSPAPGDYDGDGKIDFVVQRADGVDGRFYSKLSTGPLESRIVGKASDDIVPGDYDGDGKIDIAVVRTNVGGFYEWEFRSSLTGLTVIDTWGVAASGDLTVQGDYNGDGKTDYAIWRPGAQGRFFVMTVGVREIFGQEWGTTGDLPAARYNTF